MSVTKHGVRTAVVPRRGETEVDIAHRAVQSMVDIGAGLISDLEEIRPTPKDIHKHGKNVRVWHAVAVRNQPEAA